MLTETSTLQASIAYPNPTSDKIYLQVNDKNLLHTKGSLLDLHGKILFMFIINDWKQPVSLSGQPAGIYLLKLNNGELLTITKK